MKIIKVENNEQLSRKATEFFIDLLKSKKKAIIGLATGSTPERLYENLMNGCQTNNISFQNAVTFNLDEYAGVTKDNPVSYHYYMEHKLFRGIDIKRENAYIPNGMSSDLHKECKEYESLIKAVGKIDLQILGIGVNGHIGFNEPETSFTSRTHVVELSESTRVENSRFFSCIEDVPKKALTMGLGTIMEAKRIVLLAQGEKKAEALHKVVHGKVTEEIPASILQLHPDATIITDIDV